MKRIPVAAAVAVLALLAACSKKEGGDAAPAAQRTLPPNLEAVAARAGSS